MEKVSNFFPLAISLNQKPTPIHEIRTLLMLDNPEINKDSLSTQRDQRPSMVETTQEEPMTQEEWDEWEYQQYEAFSKEQAKLLSKMLEEGKYPFEDEPQASYTPEALYKYLDCVRGQEEAKKALCVTISDHYARFMGQPCMPKTNMLLIGPSGSGKTFMTTTLLKKLDIPYYIADASNLTPTGWKGEELMSIFVGLYVSAGKDIEKAQKGVIFLDEVDKLGMEVTDNQFKSLVQTELLKPMEGHSVTFTYDKQDITLKTDEILFIFAGHFKDLYASLNTTTQPKNS
ncbi:AAA family ATPase, partial [Helicobacter ailurogastricus]|uniref:AAA family ATPase n=1 Tax=Helicobacter ailurogastricus TaxID=1578720 RepID=UPI00255585D2